MAARPADLKMELEMSVQPTVVPNAVQMTHAVNNALAELEVLAADWVKRRRQGLQDANPTDLQRPTL